VAANDSISIDIKDSTSGAFRSQGNLGAAELRRIIAKLPDLLSQN
jgi:hypothetical protein